MKNNDTNRRTIDLKPLVRRRSQRWGAICPSFASRINHRHGRSQVSTVLGSTAYQSIAMSIAESMLLGLAVPFQASPSPSRGRRWFERSATRA